MNTENWYDTPHYYDIIFDEESEREACFLEQLHQIYGTDSSSNKLHILEPACGSGRLIQALAKRGHEVHGFDCNPHSLEYARQRCIGLTPSPQLRLDQFENYHPEIESQYDLAHCLVSTVKYILEEQDAIYHLQSIANALKPGGLYILGLHLSDYQLKEIHSETWEAEREGTKVHCFTQTWPADPVQRREKLCTQLTIHENGQSFQQKTSWDFRTYNLQQLQELLQKAPHFECVACYDFTYNIDNPKSWQDCEFDTLLVLKKCNL